MNDSWLHINKISMRWNITSSYFEISRKLFPSKLHPLGESKKHHKKHPASWTSFSYSAYIFVCKLIHSLKSLIQFFRSQLSLFWFVNCACMNMYLCAPWACALHFSVIFLPPSILFMLITAYIKIVRHNPNWWWCWEDEL